MRLLISVFVVILIYSLQLKMYKKYWRRKLLVSLEFSKDVLNYGDEAELVEVIKNSKILPLPVLNVKFATSKNLIFSKEDNTNVSDRYYRNDVFSVLGNQKIERHHAFTAGGRGVFRISELQVSSKDLFLKHSFADIFKNDTTITVLPKRIPVMAFMDIENRFLGDNPINNMQMPDPFVFRGIRQYRPYDTMKSINWKASAKNNELMVNQYQATTCNEVIIYLNLKPYMKSQADYLAEHAISIAATVSANLIGRGISTGIYTNAYDIDAPDEDAVTPHVESGLGNEHIKAIDIMLARLNIMRETADMKELLAKGREQQSEGIIRIIISTYRDDAMYEFFGEHERNEQIYWIVPERFGTPVDLRYNGMIRWDCK